MGVSQGENRGPREAREEGGTAPAGGLRPPPGPDLPARIGIAFWYALVNFLADDGAQRAGHIAFASLFAIFPFLIFLVALAGFLGQSEAATVFIASVFEVMPEEVGQAIRPAVDEVLARTRGGLLTLSLLGAIWAATSGVEALRVGLNRAYRVPIRKPFWQRRAYDLLFVAVGTVGLLFAMVAVVAGPAIWGLLVEFVGAPAPLRWAWNAGRYASGALGLFVVICLLYRWLPDRRQRWSLVVPGAVVAVLAWLGVATLFTIYLSDFSSYTMTYGSLGGVVVTLLFFYLGAAAFIYGAEYNAALAGKRPVPPIPQDPPETGKNPHKSL
jgi:membrane protein